jgi:hypothetical protein
MKMRPRVPCVVRVQPFAPFLMSAVCKRLDGAVSCGSLGTEAVLQSVSAGALTSFRYDFPDIQCFKKSFTTLKAYVNLFRGHLQCFELS